MPKFSKSIKRDELTKLGQKLIAQKLIDVGYKPAKEHEKKEGITIKGKVIPMPKVNRGI